MGSKAKESLLTVRNLFGQFDALDDLVRSGGDGALNGGVGVDTTGTSNSKGYIDTFYVSHCVG
jgi:hypothetical protein